MRRLTSLTHPGQSDRTEMKTYPDLVSKIQAELAAGNRGARKRRDA
jgi:hypothetical protein